MPFEPGKAAGSPEGPGVGGSTVVAEVPLTFDDFRAKSACGAFAALDFRGTEGVIGVAPLLLTLRPRECVERLGFS